jgi:hypothetical protein
MSSSRVYERIKLVIADPDKQFPEDFDPYNPYEIYEMKDMSPRIFKEVVESMNGLFVMRREEFEQYQETGVPLWTYLRTPDDIDLEHYETYIVVTRTNRNSAKRVSFFRII